MPEQLPTEAPIRPFDARMLDVGHGHWLYVEEVGARDGMPAGLAMSIANRWFNDDPTNLVVKGAFLLVDPKGRPDETRRLWSQAKAAGEDIDELMLVLDDKYDL